MRNPCPEGPRRPRRALVCIEPLESRALLSTVMAPFASFRGRIDGPRGAPIEVRAGPGDFGLAAGGRVILRVEARAAGDGTLDPGATRVESPTPGGAWTLTRRADAPGGSAGVTVASVRPGALRLRPAAEGGTSGDFELDVSLAGDVDGDGRVDRPDLLAIRGAPGRPPSSPGEAGGADVNGDGRVGLLDLLIASRNFGATTDLRPLEDSAGIDPAADPDGDGRVDADEVDLVGRTAPGASVRLDLGGDGSFEQELTADADGRYRFTVPLAAGANVFAVEAADTFGQVAEARITVDRGADAPRVSASFDFSEGDGGWEAGFAELPSEPDEAYELESGIRPLPSELGTDGTGYLLQGHNRSDDVFMFLKRSLGAADGVVPGQAYEVRFTIRFASDAPSGGFGIGGSPGESVTLKAGAGAEEPVAVPQDDGSLGLNVDKGNQTVGGPAASVAGTIANGEEPVESGPQPYAPVTVEHTHTVPARADSDGDLWLLVGTDSGFEGLTAIYYRQIDVELVPVSG
ncbi:dockerin type I domain-containing protein [Tautonia plasticadhaerens]|nr:dockerin type I domain-containing protein [Tautonia plasticadhaerens]